MAATKPATGVDAETPVGSIGDGDPSYASRGGHKLAGALDAFPQIAVTGKRCLDAGASTGGFTDVLLRRGAAEVVAVDVGYGQLAWPLRTDPRVRVLDRTNVRSLTPEQIGGVGRADRRRPVVHLADPGVACPDLLARAVTATCCRWSSRSSRSAASDSAVAESFATRPCAPTRSCRSRAPRRSWAGLPQACARSPLPGPSGNVEFFLWLRRPAASRTNWRLIARPSRRLHEALPEGKERR